VIDLPFRCVVSADRSTSHHHSHPLISHTPLLVHRGDYPLFSPA
jgi:hypothetical protein